MRVVWVYGQVYFGYFFWGTRNYQHPWSPGPSGLRLKLHLQTGFKLTLPELPQPMLILQTSPTILSLSADLMLGFRMGKESKLLSLYVSCLRFFSSLKFFFCTFFFLRQNLLQLGLVINLLGSGGRWFRTPNPPAFISLIPGIRGGYHLGGTGNWIKGIVHIRQALYQLNNVSSLIWKF